MSLEVVYEGKRRCETRFKDLAWFATDAPARYGGREEEGSPTDLVAAALGSCILTVLSTLAEPQGINVNGAAATVRKEMTDGRPRRISRLTLDIRVPVTVTDAQRAAFEAGVHACPVKQSLHPDIEVVLNFRWGA
ncbi:MAG TPA: OsmC family protein [Armatimonadota bacterium]